MRNRVYLVKDRLYQVGVIGRKGFTSSADAEKFFTSFKVID
jgi:hypothetical protein